MTKNTILTGACLTILASNAMAFVIPNAAPTQRKISLTTAFAATTSSNHNLPFFADVLNDDGPRTLEPPTVTEPKIPQKKATPKRSEHKEGLFSPIVLSLKAIIGDEKFNAIRGKAISLHSTVISSFVETSETPFGKTVLKTLFSITDKDASGTIEKEELKEAFNTLGFTWLLEEKPLTGIMERADSNKDGAVDLEEFIGEAPKTLRTNLIKLAKKNGGELGFLS